LRNRHTIGFDKIQRVPNSPLNYLIFKVEGLARIPHSAMAKYLFCYVKVYILSSKQRRTF